MIDAKAWAKSRNPLAVLQCVSRSRLNELAADRSFTGLLRRKVESRAERLESPGWFQNRYPRGPLTRVAYFCMEFGLGEAFPMYAGGLGILAGDHLKACSDLGVPVVGMGLLYQRGSFRQALSAFGSQVEIYPFSDPSQMPVMPARDHAGDWVNITVDLPQGEVILRAWETAVGRVRVFLLDTNHPLNRPFDRGLAGELYGSGTETRLQQEMLLGLGGWRLLRRLGVDPEICHINEGHAAFAALERARSLMLDRSMSFWEAVTATRPGNLFTTHTPVEAGFDRFPPGLIRQYLGAYASDLGLDAEEFLGLGRIDVGDAAEPFNMAYLALRTCGAVNAVSRRHEAVSRRLFAPVFPRTPLAEVPVGRVTNAVHVPSWLSAESHEFWKERDGLGRWFGEEAACEPGVAVPPAASDEVASDEALWTLRCRNREKMVEAVRAHAVLHKGDLWRPDGGGSGIGDILDSSALTLGFARRFTGYKRCTLLLRDPDRLARILSSSERPVQLVIAGKAHPSDEEGKAMIRAWAEYTRRDDVRRRVVFLVDYDMALAANLVQGVDVWINNPRRSFEASGTSGMKVLANGGLNLSELDGWWDEAYAPECGWCIGDGLPEGVGPSLQDELEAEQLYLRLEQEVVPLFYDRDLQGIPGAWLRLVRNSMKTLASEFSAHRMVSDYVRDFYIPGAHAYKARTSGVVATAREIERWREKVAELLGGVRFERVTARDEDGLHVIEAAIHPNGLGDEFRSGSLLVEAYCEPETEVDALSRGRLELHDEVDGRLVFAGSVRSAHPLEHFTARVVPMHPMAFGRLEMPPPVWAESPQETG
jgi:starch phosphorylase